MVVTLKSILQLILSEVVSASITQDNAYDFFLFINTWITKLHEMLMI